MRKIFVNSVSGPSWYTASEYFINEDGTLEVRKSGELIAVYADGAWTMVRYLDEGN